MTLILVYRSIRLPVGVLEDLPLKIGRCIIPTDFVVFEMDVEPTDPMILVRPFLATAGLIIDVKKGKIDLHLGELGLNFDINKVMKKTNHRGTNFLCGNP